ncbi:hypothetical protein ACFZA1_31760 [Streptomyces filipinensis]|uniref:hypothetical protein n=1 Tax=Streptomyces filipinensis TaxID=66887 RepID=UPI0036E1CE8A
MRTTLAAGVLAVTAALVSASTALAFDGPEGRNDMKVCDTFVGVGRGHAFYGDGCAQSHREGQAPGNGFQF